MARKIFGVSPRNETFLEGRGCLSRWVSQELMCIPHGFLALTVRMQGPLAQSEGAGWGMCSVLMWLSEWKEA